MTRAELIAALEAATGPSDELDRAIMVEVREPRDYVPYTFSIDAALTLVPKDWWLFSLRHHHTQIRARGDRHEPLRWVAELQRYPTGGRLTQGWHETSAAIALCVTALKAMEGKDG